MGRFNLDEYATVEQRITEFYKKCPEGRIVTQVEHQDGERTMVKALIYKDVAEQEKGCPLATGLAEEIRIQEKSQTSDGREYEAVNYSAWTENCETSAIGRALANWDMTGSLKGKKAPRVSKQELEKVERMREGSPVGTTNGATEKQISYMEYLIGKTGQLPDVWLSANGYDPEKLTSLEVSKIIKTFK